MPLALAVELAATLLVLAVELADVTFCPAVGFATMISDPAGANGQPKFEGVKKHTDAELAQLQIQMTS